MTSPITSPPQDLPQTTHLAHTGLTLRSVLIGMGAVVCQCLATPYNDFHVGGTYLAGNHLPIAVVFVMLVFVLSVNVLLRKLKPGTELQGGELLIIWGMMLVASGIPSSGLMRYLVPLAVSPHYFATAENEWITLFHQHLPDWMVVKDPKAVFYFYEQLPDGDSIPWRAWLKPIVGWSAFVLIFYFVTICWTVLLRKQWVEHERFTFPIVQLPQEMFQPAIGQGSLESVLQITADVVRFCCACYIARVAGIAPLFSSHTESASRFPNCAILYRETVIRFGVVAHGAPVYLSFDRRYRLSAHSRNLV